MALKSYNGFSGAQRNKAAAWIREQYHKGLAHPPLVCCACGQDRGVMDNHQEDYSEPYGPHIFAFPLCYPCHLMVHCRARSPIAWATYRQLVRDGMRLRRPFMSRDFGRLCRELLNGLDPQGFEAGGIPGSTVLDEIDQGRHDPRSR